MYKKERTRARERFAQVGDLTIARDFNWSPVFFECDFVLVLEKSQNARSFGCFSTPSPPPLSVSRLLHLRFIVIICAQNCAQTRTALSIRNISRLYSIWCVKLCVCVLFSRFFLSFCSARFSIALCVCCCLSILLAELSFIFLSFLRTLHRVGRAKERLKRRQAWANGQASASARALAT